jgi:hypothetical protein
LTFCITGRTKTPRRDFETLIANHGGISVRTVTAKCTHLISAQEGTSKHDSAIEKGVVIMDEDQFHQFLESKVGQRGAQVSDGEDMDDIPDGGQVEVIGSGEKPYVMKNLGGVFSCTCPAWRNQSAPVNARTCKHLQEKRGLSREQARIAEVLGTDGSVSRPAATGLVKKSQPPLLLANKWEGKDVTGWWVSEKFDGMRAYWDGKGTLISRLGNKINAPEWFLKSLSTNIDLDGELWKGRGLFQETTSIVRSFNSDHRLELFFFLNCAIIRNSATLLLFFLSENSVNG